ncbi:MAG: hypothetical protein RLN72_06490 [Henriciella sp.]
MAAKDSEKTREDRLKLALRDNLKRRKQAARKARDDSPSGEEKPGKDGGS